MKRRDFLGRSTLAASGALVSALAGHAAKSGFSVEQSNSPQAGKNFPILTLEGTPRNRGRVHGEAMRAEIQETLKRWKDGVGRSLGIDPDAYSTEFIENTNFLPAIKTWTPGLLEEVEGLAEGSGLDFKTMYAYQMGDEDWWYARKKSLHKRGLDVGACSALAVFDEGRVPLLAQNMDLFKMYDGAQVLLHIKHDGSSLESYVYSFAGYLALTGLNNRPLGVCCNTLLQLNYATDGLPVAFIVRRVLELGSVAEAAKFLQSIKHASGQNYTVADPVEAASFECSGGKVSRFVPSPGARRVYHTNHPLVNDDQSIYRAILEKFAPDKRPKKPSNSEVRFDFLAQKLSDASRPVDATAIKSILGSSEIPICFDGKEMDDSFTLGCLIMEMSSPPLLHLSPGPPCARPFQTYNF